jgi:hypothetical protein
MMAHELLRQAALILTDGWSHNANARDATGRIVPLFSGVGRAAINPEAVAFSPYGAICKAASQNPGTRRRPFQESQRSVMMLGASAAAHRRQPGRHQSGRGGALALWRDLQGRQSESWNPAHSLHVERDG